MRGYPFLFWAYNIIWLGIAGYVLFLFLRLRKAGRRLDRIERKVLELDGVAARKDDAGR